MKRLILAFGVLIFCLSIKSSAAGQGSAELSVLSSNLSQTAISELIPIFEKTYKIKVRVQYANNPILKQQIEAGAKFDVVIIEPKMLKELSTAGFVDKTSVVDLAKVGMALVSKEGAPAVDIGGVESFKKVLLSARSVAYTANGHSGAVFLSTLEQLGLSDEMKPRLMPIVGRFSTQAVTDGSAQYTAFPGVGLGPGVQIAGMFPEEVQTYIGISAGVSPRAAEPGSARTFLEYLQSGSANALFKSQGFTPLALALDSVLVEKEPMHRLKFENDFVRFFDVLIPAGKSSLIHTHLYDGLSIRLSNSSVTEKFAAGGDVVTEIKYGEARFGARPSPMSHQVVATSTNDFRNIFIEILPSKGPSLAAIVAPLTDRHVVLIDNERIRVSRLVLKPGESSKPHTHPMNSLGIILYDAKIEISGPAGSPQIIESKAGEFAWQASGTTHVIRNIGTKIFEAIDVEIK